MKLSVLLGAFVLFGILTSCAVFGAYLVFFKTTEERPQRVRYDNYKVLNLKINTPEKSNFFEQLKQLPDFNSLYFDAYENTIISPSQLQKLVPILENASISSEILTNNIQEIIDIEEVKTKAAGDAFSWDRYHSYENIQKFIDEIIENHKKVVSPFIIGKSYEGKDIRGMKISFKDSNRGIFLLSGIHACEWITPATTTFLIKELLTSNKTEIRDIAENVDWYIIPVFNVDGFIYSHEKDRMWRNTRQPTPDGKCFGADPSRNFDTHWNSYVGSSDDPCDDHFRGAVPFSEPECKALAEYVGSIKDKIGVFLAFHAYGQFILSPYGHSKTELPDNYQDMLRIAKASSDAILDQGYGTIYKYGSTASVTSAIATGNTVDYAYNALDIKMGFIFRFRDLGKYGNLLPSTYILPNCQETVASMIALVKKSKELNYL